jgi:hypothetical protein
MGYLVSKIDFKAMLRPYPIPYYYSIGFNALKMEGIKENQRKLIIWDGETEKTQ